MAENDWQEIEKQKERLLESVIDDLTEGEFTILESTLQLEAENRHLHKPHGIKKRILETVERVIE